MATQTRNSSITKVSTTDLRLLSVTNFLKRLRKIFNNKQSDYRYSDEALVNKMKQELQKARAQQFSIKYPFFP